MFDRFRNICIRSNLFVALRAMGSQYSDPFGFTKQTATLLRGLGASELIPECKKRDISTDVLHQLTVQELIMLGIDPKKAEEVHSSLNIKRRRSCIVLRNIGDRAEHFVEIIKLGKQHLSLIQAFVAYFRLRLARDRINTFVDPDKSLSASQVLPVSVNATLTEVQEAKRALCELENLILGLKGVKVKRNNTRRVCVFVSGLGLATLVLFKICANQLFRCNSNV